MSHRKGLLWEEELVAAGEAARRSFVPSARAERKDVPKALALSPMVRSRGGRRGLVEQATWHVGDEPTPATGAPATWG